MKIYAYKVQKTDDQAMEIEAAIAHFYGKSLPDRTFEVGNMIMRIEDYKCDNGLVYGNFVNIRAGSGPGIVSNSAPLADIPIGQHENVGEDTAVVYDPSNKYIVVQYNHHGPKAPSIRDYLRMQSGGLIHAYHFYPKLTPTSESDLRSLSIVSRIEVSFAVPELAGNPNVANSAVASAIDIARANGAQHINLILSNRAGMVATLAKDTALGLWNTFTGDSAMTKLTVRGTEVDGAPRENIDLIADRLFHEANIPLSAGRRLALADRWSCLKTTLDFWKSSNELQ